MAKKVLIIDPDADRCALYKHAQPQFAPDLELATVATMDEALAALAVAPVDTIVLSVGGCDDDSDKNTKRHRMLQRACPAAECYLFNTRTFSTDKSDLSGLFHLFALSANNIAFLYPRLHISERQPQRKAKTC